MISDNANWDKLWRRGFTFGPLDGWAREIFLTIGELLKDSHGPSILSAGCGRGLIDHWLMEVFGWHVTLLDNSRQCIKNLKKSLRSVDSAKYKIIHGSVLNLPFPDGSFDLVWNEGVLEHFHDDEFQQALSEMARVSRRFVIIDVPNAGCKPYMLIKEWLEANGKWSWGYEKPRVSLRKDLENVGVRVLSERSIGGRQTVINYLEMVPEEHRQGIFKRLEPEDFEIYPHLLSVGDVNV